MRRRPEVVNKGRKLVEKGLKMATVDMDVTLKQQEFRILRTGTFTDDKTKREIEYMTLVVEHPDTCEQQKISVPQEQRQDLKNMNIRKGEYLDLMVHVKAGSNFASMKLVQVLAVYDEDGTVEGY